MFVMILFIEKYEKHMFLIVVFYVFFYENLMKNMFVIVF